MYKAGYLMWLLENNWRSKFLVEILYSYLFFVHQIHIKITMFEQKLLKFLRLLSTPQRKNEQKPLELLLISDFVA